MCYTTIAVLSFWCTSLFSLKLVTVPLYLSVFYFSWTYGVFSIFSVRNVSLLPARRSVKHSISCSFLFLETSLPAYTLCINVNFLLSRPAEFHTQITITIIMQVLSPSVSNVVDPFFRGSYIFLVLVFAFSFS